MLKKRGEATLGEIMLIVVLVGVICLGLFFMNKKQSEQNTYTGQAQDIHPATATNRYALLELAFSPFNFNGCSRSPSTTPQEKYRATPLVITNTAMPAVAPAPEKEESGW